MGDLVTFRQPNGLPGAGPWRILTECPSPFHNTQHSALGRHLGGHKCICPRALHLKATRRQNGQPKAPKVARQRLWQYSRFLYSAPNVTIAPMPEELNRAACATKEGIPYAEAGMDRHMTKRGMELRQKAKDWCNTACPVLDQCRAYIEANEEPRGSWGGVWGGLDPWERRGLRLVLIQGKVRIIENESVSAA